MNVLVTGADGFVGTALCESLRNTAAVRRAVRNASQGPVDFETTVVGDIGPETDWGPALKGIDVVVHLAARVHVLNEREANPVSAFRRVNTAGTARLARECLTNNVKRMIFLSTIGVNGRETEERPFSEDSVPAPHNEYSRSKWEAEQLLAGLSRDYGLDVTVLRAPLVYGPRAVANFLRLWKAVQAGIPLPLGSVENRRSLVYVGNLVDAIFTCVRNPLASGRTFLVSDGEDVSTPQLIRLIAEAQGKPAPLFRFPVALLRGAAQCVGLSQQVDGLVASLQVDSNRIRSELGWTPPFTLRLGLDNTAAWFSACMERERAPL